jgi:hypothetical protein
MATKEEEPIRSIPLSFVPTPTKEYRTYRKTVKATVQPGFPVPPFPIPHPIPTPIPTPIPIPIPIPLLPGPRVLIWKQDPTVVEIALRKVWLPSFVHQGPRDVRLTNGVGPGAIPPVSANAFGDFIQSPGTDGFDAVQAFAVARMTLTMLQRALRPNPIPWQWNSATNAEPLSVFPHGLPGVMNAFYSRTAKAVKFGDFLMPGSSPPEQVFTCRSLDIVSHETGHGILDGLKPAWLAFGNPPQTGGLHESFGDLCAIFLALSQLDQVEAVIAQTKSNLHDKTFLADLAEQFGLALGRPNGLRNADNDLKLSEVGTEVHAISQVFTGAIYDILADVFAFERSKALWRDAAAVLYEVGQYILSLVARALVAAPGAGAIFADVANQMLNIALADGKPVQYRNYIRNRFAVREVVVSPTPLDVDHEGGVAMAPGIEDAPGAVQDRRTCCGTMKLPEYLGAEKQFEAEEEELKKAVGGSKKK